MNLWEFLAILVMVGAIASVLKARYGVVEDKDGNDVFVGRNADPEKAQLEADVKALKERIAVLERLATDDQRAIELDREIARLRDKTN